jgi:hypothetical protein
LTRKEERGLTTGSTEPRKRISYDSFGVMCAALVGDAIDDITDIAVEMEEIEWRWKNTSEADALWHFRFGASRHWIDHMRQLQFYLNARYYEE